MQGVPEFWSIVPKTVLFLLIEVKEVFTPCRDRFIFPRIPLRKKKLALNMVMHMSRILLICRVGIFDFCSMALYNGCLVLVLNSNLDQFTMA